MSTPTYKSFTITVRPLDGITDETVDAVKKWLIKQGYAVAVLEKEGSARHLHAQIWYDTPKSKGDTCKALVRICERTITGFTDKEKRVLRNGVDIGYSDWYLDYLIENDNKEDNPNILIYNPPDITSDYYASEEQQERIKTVSRAVDQRMAELEQKCIEYLGKKELKDNTIISMKLVAEFLADAMFVSRSIRCVLQQRDRKALCTTLHAYMNRQKDVYLFMDKSEDEKKYEKLLSQLNIQECQPVEGSLFDEDSDVGDMYERD